jgi:hypothetical protein
MSLINKYLKKIVRSLRGQKFFYANESVFSAQSTNFQKSIVLIRAFYGYSFVIAVNSYHNFMSLYGEKIYYKPLWVFGPLKAEQLQHLVPTILWMWIFSSLFLVFFFESRLVRLLQALAVFFMVAIINSDGHFSNNLHGFLWMSMLFFLLPLSFKGPASQSKRIHRHKILLSVWFAQLMICTFYAMSGFWKVTSILRCAVDSNLQCQLDQWILTNISAREAIFYHQFAPWRDAFYKYPWLSFASYMATIWIHLVSFHFAFRLNLHNTFGFLRLIFHLGTFLFFGVNFSDMAAPVALVFLLSPFDRPKNVSVILKQLLRLPPFSWLIRNSKHES